MALIAEANFNIRVVRARPGTRKPHQLREDEECSLDEARTCPRTAVGQCPTQIYAVSLRRMVAGRERSATLPRFGTTGRTGTEATSSLRRRKCSSIVNAAGYTWSAILHAKPTALRHGSRGNQVKTLYPFRIWFST